MVELSTSVLLLGASIGGLACLDFVTAFLGRRHRAQQQRELIDTIHHLAGQMRGETQEAQRREGFEQ